MVWAVWIRGFAAGMAYLQPWGRRGQQILVADRQLRRDHFPLFSLGPRCRDGDGLAQSTRSVLT